MYGQMYGQIEEATDGQMNDLYFLRFGLMDGWIDRWRDGKTYEHDHVCAYLLGADGHTK